MNPFVASILGVVLLPASIIAMAVSPLYAAVSVSLSGTALAWYWWNET